jgi:hypothetical protein
VQYLSSQSGWDIIGAYRAVFWAYACFGLVKFLLALCLSDKCEVKNKAELDELSATAETEPLLENSAEDAETSRPEALPEVQPQRKQNRFAMAQMSKHTWAILFKLLLLFSVDSFASGLVPL